VSNREPNWNELTVLFGGTFDPPHSAHLTAMRGLLAHPGAARVIAIPSGRPPHKPAHAEAAHRLRMTELLCAEAEGISVDPIEIDRETAGKPSYSFDTLVEVAKRLGSSGTAAKLAFAIGTDQLTELASWHRFPEILDLCHWIVLARKPDGTVRARAGIRALEDRGLARASGDGTWRVGTAGARTLKIVETPAPALSSTEIRRRIALNGDLPEGVLPPDLTRYLKEFRLYGT